MNARRVLIAAFVVLSLIALADMVFIPAEFGEDSLNFHFEFNLDLPDEGR